MTTDLRSRAAAVDRATLCRRDTPLILGRYARALGPSPVGQPTLMVTWAGPTTGMTSLGGSVLPGLDHDGASKARACSSAERARQRRYARWFVAHETAHFWLGQAVGYRQSAQQLDHRGRRRPARLPRHRRRRSRATTRKAAARGASPIALPLPAQRRHRRRLCSAASFALIMPAARSSRSSPSRPAAATFTAFVKTLIARNRATGVVTRRMAGLARRACARCRDLARDSPSCRRGPARSGGGDRVALHPRRHPLHRRRRHAA